MKHLIFYDGECPLCNRAIRFILSADLKGAFYFAPLKGETAAKKIAHLHLKNPNLDTLVLLQNVNTSQEKLLIEGKGAFRVLWLLGGKYKLLGWLSFLPSFPFDAAYRLLARYRYRLFSRLTPFKDKSRFLP